MTIRATTWHLRLYRFLWAAWRAFDESSPRDVLTFSWLGKIRYHRRADVPRNLCRYFWFTVTGPPVLSLVVIVLVVILVVGSVVIYPFILLGAWAYDRRQARRARRGEPPSQTLPLLVAYVRASKRRACPVIEVVP